MIDTLVALLAGHVAADFLLQTGWIVRHKRHWGVLLLHIALVGIATAAAIGFGDPRTLALPLGIILGTHLVFDAIKLRVGDGWRAFLIDQGAHVAVIAGVAVAFPGLAGEGLWARLPPDARPVVFSGLTLFAGALVSLRAGELLLARFMQPFARALRDSQPGESGLPGAGAAIGWLERALILLFVLIGKPEGIGFLIAAKSILRFSDLNQAHFQKLTEYVIIGTLLSFAWGIAAAGLTKAGFDHYWP